MRYGVECRREHVSGSSRNKVEFSCDRKLGVVIVGGRFGKEGRPWIVEAQKIRIKEMSDFALSPVLSFRRCFGKRGGATPRGCIEGESSGWRLRAGGPLCGPGVWW